MAGLVDHEALVLDLERALQERASWGRGQVLGLIAELRQEHRVDESADAAVLRRFGAHLTDTFFGLVPRPSATLDPLPATDLQTVAGMDGGAESDHQTEEPQCPKDPRAPSPRPPAPASRSARASRPTRSRVAPATT